MKTLQVFHVNLAGTLQSTADWDNKLHPLNDGFSTLADKIDAVLQVNI